MKVFISYSHRDAAALERLHTHLAVLRRENLIDEWYDREILGGGDFNAAIAQRMDESELFLLLVSPDFLNSDYCYDVEMKRALDMHENGQARVVPIIIEPCDWTSSPLGRLKAVPKDGKPIAEWTNPNTAYLDVVQELRRIVQAYVQRAKPAPGVASAPTNTAEPAASRRYRVKHDFDAIEKAEFLEKSFAEVRDYFQQAAEEITGVDELKARFVSYSATSFGGTLVNRKKQHGTAHITVHRRTGMMGLPDIYFSFNENAAANTSNGGFSLEVDEYELFFSGSVFGFGDRKEKLSARGVAESLWIDFLKQAGVTYD